MMIKYVNELFNFIQDSPTPFHNVAKVKSILDNLKFTELKENEEWNVETGKSYYIIRNNTSIIAVKVGQDVKKFNIVASHNDSPTFKVKPNGSLTKADYVEANTEVYGGPILSTWFDRPLSVAGRIFVETKDGIVERLVDLAGHTFIIPSIAPHLTRGAAPENHLNPQVDLLPIINCGDDKSNIVDQVKKTCVFEEAGEKLLSHDLYLYNKEKPEVIGLKNNMIASPKLDDLECAFCSLEAFLEATPKEAINVCCIFNNEEVGSRSSNAAASTFLPDVISRVSMSLNLNKYVLLANSMLVSADNAHAIHPAAMGKADPTNMVYMNKGIVIKSNANLSYTTDASSYAEMAHVCNLVEVPYQSYTNPSDIRGGGTLGAIAQSQTSIKCVDIGLAQLAMHSCYETAGAYDIEYMVKGIKSFYINR